MAKYARLTINSTTGECSACDVFTTDPNDNSTFMKIPQGVDDPIAWLDTYLVGPKKEEFDYFDESFRQVPDGVVAGARFLGDRATSDVMNAALYENLDGTDGNGKPRQ